MEIYILLSLWSFVTGVIFHINRWSNYKKRAYYLLINFIPLAFVCGFRSDQVGTDTLMYYDWYSNFIAGAEIEPSFFVNFADGGREEIGYIILNKICYNLDLGAQTVLAIMAVLTIAGFLRFFYKYSENAWLSLILFINLTCYHECFNTVRQCFASMILCNAIGFLLHHAKFKYICSVLVAMCFHFSSSFFLILTLMNPIKKIKIIVFSGISIGACLFVLEYGIYFLFLIDPKYAFYLMRGEFMPDGSVTFSVIRVIAFLLVIVALYKNVYVKSYAAEVKEKTLWYIFFLIVSSYIMLVQNYIPLIARYNVYLFIYVTVAIPLLLNSIKNIKYRIAVQMLIVCLSFAYYIESMLLERHGVIPYSLFFSVL